MKILFFYHARNQNIEITFHFSILKTVHNFVTNSFLLFGRSIRLFFFVSLVYFYCVTKCIDKFINICDTFPDALKYFEIYIPPFVTIPLFLYH